MTTYREVPPLLDGDHDFDCDGVDSGDGINDAVDASGGDNDGVVSTDFAIVVIIVVVIVTGSSPKLPPSSRVLSPS